MEETQQLSGKISNSLFMDLSLSLLNWYDKNKRSLPWRETRDPYCIWLSEVILQQTRVNQGLDYYHRFLNAFPDVQSLAAASEQEVLKQWQGLGYYSRARNLHHAAKEIAGKYKGIFPSTAAELKKLKGIGDYTAAAVASICFDEPVAVLDGNVARVISRMHALDIPVDSTEGRAFIVEEASCMLKNQHPGTFNQALMELGALVCTPKNPDCPACPLSVACLALKRNETERFPLKLPKKLPTLRYLNYLVASFEDREEVFFLVKKRTANDIWKGLFDFQCIETAQAATVEDVLGMAEKQGFFSGLPYIIKQVSGEHIHQLTHRRLIARFIHIQLQGVPGTLHNATAVSKHQLAGLPVPRLIDRYLANLD